MTPGTAGRESLPPGLRTGSVVLDIGGDVGALVIRTDPGGLGAEIEVSRDGDGDRRTHVAVLRRDGGEPPGVVAAVFGALRAGDYQVMWCDGPAVPARVRVVGGAVAELDWRSG